MKLLEIVLSFCYVQRGGRALQRHSPRLPPAVKVRLAMQGWSKEGFESDLLVSLRWHGCALILVGCVVRAA